MKIKNNLSTIMPVLITSMALSACGGSDGGSPEPTPPTPTPVIKSGVFIDAAVKGLSYQSGGQSGVTALNGGFNYEDGKDISFSVGGITLGSVNGSDVITPVDLVDGAKDENNQAVTNIIRFLQTLDQDGDLSNGITISKAVRDAAAGYSLNFDQSPAEFESDGATAVAISELTTLINGTGSALVSSDSAQLHMKCSLLELLGGEYSGNFSGDDSGTWSININKGGVISGTALSTVFNENFAVTGTISSSGTMAMGMAGFADFSGSSNDDGSVSGSWLNVTQSSSGLFDGSKTSDTAAPATGECAKGNTNTGPQPSVTPVSTTDSPFSIQVGMTQDFAIQANDPTPNDSFSYNLIISPLLGTYSLNNAGVLSYTATEVGTDSFEVEVIDTEDNNASITIYTNNTAPDQNAPQPLSTPSNSASNRTNITVGGQQIFSINANDADASDTFSYSITTQATLGSVAVGAQTSEFVYTPTSAGNDSFVVTVTDSSGLSGTVTIYANNIANAPQPIASPTSSAGNRVSITIGSQQKFSINANDPDAGDTFSYSITSQATLGNVVVGTQENEFIYTPTSAGDDSFIVTVTDSSGLSETVTVHVSNIANAPQPTSMPSSNAGARINITVGGSQTFSINANDADAGDTFSYSVTGQPSLGSVAVGTQTNEFIYTPTSAGNDSFVITVTDSTGLSGTVSVYADNIANAPQPTSSPSSNAGARISITVGGNQTFSINANDADAGDTFSYSVTGQPSLGGVAVGTQANEFIYTPTSAGNDSFVITVTDSTGLSGTVTVYANNIANAPQPTSSPFSDAGNPISVTVGGNQTFSITANDADAGDTFSYSVTGQPSLGSVSIGAQTNEFVYTSASAGNDSFVVTVTDSTGLAGTVELFVNNEVGLTTSTVSISYISSTPIAGLKVQPIATGALSLSSCQQGSGPPNSFVMVNGSTIGVVSPSEQPGIFDIAQCTYDIDSPFTPNVGNYSVQIDSSTDQDGNPIQLNESDFLITVTNQ